MKPIRFSPHAVEHWKVREILREDAEAAARSPARRETSRPPRELRLALTDG
jgi:hypothetical protein